jgi:hypothetical protein
MMPPIKPVRTVQTTGERRYSNKSHTLTPSLLVGRYERTCRVSRKLAWAVLFVCRLCRFCEPQYHAAKMVRVCESTRCTTATIGTTWRSSHIPSGRGKFLRRMIVERLGVIPILPPALVTFVRVWNLVVVRSTVSQYR